MLKAIDDFVWGVPLIVLILAVGIFLTIRLRGLQITKLPLAIKHMVANEKNGEHGEVSSFGALAQHCRNDQEQVTLSAWQPRLSARRTGCTVLDVDRSTAWNGDEIFRVSACN